MSEREGMRSRSADAGVDVIFPKITLGFGRLASLLLAPRSDMGYFVIVSVDGLDFGRDTARRGQPQIAGVDAQTSRQDG